MNPSPASLPPGYPVDDEFFEAARLHLNGVGAIAADARQELSVLRVEGVEAGAGDKHSVPVEDIVDELTGTLARLISHDEQSAFLVGVKGVERVPIVGKVDLLGVVRHVLQVVFKIFFLVLLRDRNRSVFFPYLPDEQAIEAWIAMAIETRRLGLRGFGFDSDFSPFQNN